MPLPMYEDLACRVETTLGRLLAGSDYDSVANFSTLHAAYRSSTTPTLRDFFRRYDPPIREGQHTCVGLGLELIDRLKRLETEFPGVAHSLILVSCEEAIVNVKTYAEAANSPAEIANEVEKEHVMVALHLMVDNREGVMLVDPGYHVGRVITVMQDRAYPHTGWFTQNSEQHNTKEYMYSFCIANPGYIEWAERHVRNESVKFTTSLVYVQQPYLDGVTVTERRNLVYNFRSLLKRDRKGVLIAGLYFPLALKDAHFTLFYDLDGDKRRIKLKFSTFLRLDEIPDNIKDAVILCNERMQYEEGKLLRLLHHLATVMADTSFLKQLLSINDDICQITGVCIDIIPEQIE